MGIEDRENALLIDLEAGQVVVELFDELAPLHAERLKTLARAGEYDGVAFHRVLEGFVAQTGDVRFGDLTDGYDPARVGTGDSALPDLPAEISAVPFERAVVGMARRPSSLDSANSQFFIMLDEASNLNGAYTAVGRVIEGMEFVDALERVDPQRELVTDPDRMVEVAVAADAGLADFEAREVALLYEAALDRDGDIDFEGLNFWIDVREDGLSIEAVAGLFLDSGEFETAFGDPEALDDRALVERLYLNVLDRPGEAEGVAFWTAAVADPGFSRAELLHAFAVSVENAETLEFVDTLDEVRPGEWDFA